MNSMNSHTCEEREENSTTSMTVKEKQARLKRGKKMSKKAHGMREKSRNSPS